MNDRLATAWLARAATHPMARLQRADALARLTERSPRSHLKFQWRQPELIAAAALLAVTAFLYVAPSPMAQVLERQAAEQRTALLAAERIDELRLDATLSSSLTPEQARQLDELLQQAYIELARAQSEREAMSVLSRAEEQLGQLGNPTATDLEEALAAMSETLTQEPLTRSLGEALQRNEPRGATEAMQALEQRVDQLSDVQRQGLSRALQRAANVGRADPRTANALREAARAVAANEPSDEALEAAATALREALQSATSEAALRSTAQRLRDLRTDLSSGTVPSQYEDLSVLGDAGVMPMSPGLGEEAVAIDPSVGRGSAPESGDPSTASGTERSPSGGTGGQQLGQAGQPLSAGMASENVFVPGRAGEGPSDQDIQQQPFTLRGQPRPYREVLSEYAQSGRDYVDRAAVSSSVRELVKQYFAQLEGN
jgi:hypothetical protein